VVIRLRITQLWCMGCGRIGWVEEKHLLCLHCLAHYLDKLNPNPTPRNALLAKIRMQLREFSNHG
jgi:hypothetical protein